MTEDRRVQYLEIDKILIPEERVTSVVDDSIMAELEESIKERGILQPLYVMEVDGKYILVDGLHRLLVAKKLKLQKVPVLIKRGSEKDLLIENLIINRQRGTSDPIGEALVIDTLVREHKMSLYAAAKACNISESTARKYLALLTLPSEVKEMVRRKQLGVECAYWIAKLQDDKLKIEVARDAIQYGYTAQMCRARVLQLLRPDLEPEEVGYTFTPQGEPQRILPKCFLCGREIQGDPQYIWLDRECMSLLEEFREQWNRQEEESPPAQPQSPAQPPAHIPAQPTYYSNPPAGPQQPAQYNIVTSQQPQPVQYSNQPAQPSAPAGDSNIEWVWLDDHTLVNVRTKEIRRI